MFECDKCKYITERKTDYIRHTLSNSHLDALNFTDEQKIVSKAIIEYIFKSDSSTEEDGIRINAQGGAGKTYTVMNSLRYCNNIIILGPTQKSLKVVRDVLGSDNRNSKCKTVQNFFGWTQEKNEDDKDVSSYILPTIPKNTVFIFDEISMMTSEHYALFKHCVSNKYKYILLGDINQLPPIENDVESILPKEVKLYKPIKDISLFFKLNCKDFKLTKNLRSKNKELINVLKTQIKCINNHQSISIKKNGKFIIEEIKKNPMMDYIFLAFRNKTVDDINIMIRKNIFTNHTDEYIIGDKITFNTFFIGYSKSIEKQLFIYNSDRFTVSEVYNDSMKISLKTILDDSSKYNSVANYDKIKKLLDKEKYTLTLELWKLILCFDLEVSFAKYEFRELIKSFKKEIATYIKKYIGKDTDEEKLLRKLLFNNLDKIIKTFCPKISYSFATTIHKSQGSTYDYVYIPYDEINNTHYISYRSKLIYTAFSRTRLDYICY